MPETDTPIPPYLDRVVDFPDGSSYELLKSITDLRSCHDGTPAEARILFTCRQIRQPSGRPPRETDNNEGEEEEDDDDDDEEEAEEFIMKVKVQEPDNTPDSRIPSAGPSTTTAAELQALELFRKANNPHVPQLVAWKRAVQGPDGPLPGGFLTYLVMTKLRGETLYTLQYWPMAAAERAEIVRAFVPVLRSVYALGIEPTDRALRNILWDRRTRTCAIIDFELWRGTTSAATAAGFEDETKMLQGWGLARPPPARGWWEAWNQQGR